MTAREDKAATGHDPAGSRAESEATREEVIETLLHPDRAHHDELGQTQGSPADTVDGTHAPGPREQGAAPLDVTKVDE